MGRLKGIPPVISPDLMHALMSMGHGDEIVLGDADFPASSSCANGAKLISADGHDIPTLLKAILQFFPLDTYVFNPVILMDLVNADKQQGQKVPIWDYYKTICSQAEKKDIATYKMERFEFYERAKSAFAIVATGETAPYGNIILKKGVLSSPEDC